MIAQEQQLFGDGVIIRHHSAAVTETSKELGGIEAERRRTPECSGGTPTEFGAQRLCSVLDDIQTVTLGDRRQTVHIGGPTVELYRADGFRARRDGSFDDIRIDQVIRAAVHEHWGSAREMNRRRGRHHRMRWNDDFVSLLQPGSSPAHDQTIGRVADTECVLHSQVFGEVTFEDGQIALLNECAAMQYVAKRRDEGRLIRGEGTAIVEKRNWALGFDLRCHHSVSKEDSSNRYVAKIRERWSLARCVTLRRRSASRAPVPSDVELGTAKRRPRHIEKRWKLVRLNRENHRPPWRGATVCLCVTGSLAGFSSHRLSVVAGGFRSVQAGLMTTRYEDITETTGMPVTDEAADMLATRYSVAADIGSRARVLELGCAAGQGLGLIAARARFTVGGDYSAALLASAQRHYGTRIPLVQLSAEMLPFSDRSFDVVLFFEATYYVPDMEKAFGEIARVLAPDGTVMFVNANPERPDFIRSPHSTHYHTADEFRRALSARGFDVDTEGSFPVAAPASGALRVRAHILRLVRQGLEALHLVPRTLKGRARLKRLLYGKLRLVPPELSPGFGTVSPRTRIGGDSASPDGFKVLYITGRKRA